MRLDRSRVGGCVFACILSGCASNAGTPAESSPTPKEEPSIESLFEDPAPELSKEPKASERLLPFCKTEKSPPRFPRSSNGASFRAIVSLVIAQDGSATELCYLRVEGPTDIEEKTMSDRDSWSYDKQFAGQPREKLVTYRPRQP